MMLLADAFLDGRPCECEPWVKLLADVYFEEIQGGAELDVS